MARSCGATRAGSSLMSPREPCENSRNPLGKRMARPTLAEGRGELDLAALNPASPPRYFLLCSVALAFGEALRDLVGDRASRHGPFQPAGLLLWDLRYAVKDCCASIMLLSA